MSNNYVNRSLQGGLPTQADSMSYGQGAGQTNVHPGNNSNFNAVGGETIQTHHPGGGLDANADENGVSLTNLLTNIKVQRPSGAQA